MLHVEILYRTVQRLQSLVQITCIYVLALQLAIGRYSFTRFQHKTGGINPVDLNEIQRTGTCLISKYAFTHSFDKL